MAGTINHEALSRLFLDARTQNAWADGDVTDEQLREIIDLMKMAPTSANCSPPRIIFHDYRDGIVYLQMRGACSGCPSSTATLQNGIENLLKHFLPEVQEVRPV